MANMSIQVFASSSNSKSTYNNDTSSSIDDHRDARKIVNRLSIDEGSRFEDPVGFSGDGVPDGRVGDVELRVHSSEEDFRVVRSELEGELRQCYFVLRHELIETRTENN